MNARYAPPCPHRCCVDEGRHEHEHPVPECPDCESLADVHPLAVKAARIAALKHPNTEQGSK